ncbi:hypothetical protein B0H14DRAFT_2752597 [Mycena olivaceomarginata]|nr:hypothetical protein B0H14DRAFT_2752597 [Mycena olivaceomarginata]
MSALRSTRGLSGSSSRPWGVDAGSVTENLRRSLPRWHTKDTQQWGHKNERQPSYSRGPNIAAIVSVDVVAWILAVSTFCVSRDVHASKSGLAVRRKKTSSRPSAARRRPDLSIGGCTMHHLVMSTFRQLRERASCTPSPPTFTGPTPANEISRNIIRWTLVASSAFSLVFDIRSCGEISFLRRRLRSSTTQKCAYQRHLERRCVPNLQNLVQNLEDTCPTCAPPVERAVPTSTSS